LELERCRISTEKIGFVTTFSQRGIGMLPNFNGKIGFGITISQRGTGTLSNFNNKIGFRITISQRGIGTLPNYNGKIGIGKMITQRKTGFAREFQLQKLVSIKRMFNFMFRNKLKLWAFLFILTI